MRMEKLVDSIKYEESQTITVPWILRVAILNFQDFQSLNYKESEHLLGKKPRFPGLRNCIVLVYIELRC
jgi:hypothetical protein